MIKLLALTTLQAILGVGGIAMLTRALHGKPMELRVITSALFTVEGMIGAVILFGSFIVMTVILSFAKMSVYIPLNTALTFLVTIILTVMIGQERVTLTTALGMVLIVAGVALVSAKS